MGRHGVLQCTLRESHKKQAGRWAVSSKWPLPVPLQTCWRQFIHSPEWRWWLQWPVLRPCHINNMISKNKKKKIKLQQISFNGSRQMRRWGAKDGEGAVGMTVQFAVHREGLLGWRRSHRLVGWDYCPVSALYDHTHMHAHNWRTHILRVKTERGGRKAGLVGQVPAGSGVLPSPALSVQPPGSMWVCVWCPHIKSEMGLVPPTLHSRLCFSSGGAAACRPLSGLTCARRKPARRTGHRHRCYVLDWRTLALLWADREKEERHVEKQDRERSSQLLMCPR